VKHAFHVKPTLKWVRRFPPWCIGGDFLFPSKRSGEACFSPAMMEFCDCIYELDLMDLLLVGETFTWSNNRDFHSWSRIDKFLDLFQKRSHRLCSNHVKL
jgi:hypothetical protein